MNRIVPRIALGVAVVLGATVLGGWTTTQSAAHAANPDTSNRDAVVQVYLTRHGETILNKLGRVQGWSDSPLTDKGVAVATKVGTNLGAEVGKFDAAYSADMVRHYETATLMLKGMGSKLSVTRDERLREINFGTFEGGDGAKMYGAIMQKLGITNPADIANYSLDDLMGAMKSVASTPGLPAEDCTDVGARMKTSLDEIAADAAKHRERNVLVASSGISISCLLEDLGTEAPEGGIANGAVNLLQYKAGAWTVKSVNDTHYAQ